MPFSNSFPASHTVLPENIPPVSPNNFRHSMSQGGYISALMTNHSRPSLSPLAGITSGYSQVVNAERRSAISYADWSNLSYLATQTPEVVYCPSTMRNNNMIPLLPPASRASDLISLQQISRGLVPSDYSQLQSDSMSGINRAAFCNFCGHFAFCTCEMVSSQFITDSNIDYPLQFPWVSTANIPIAAQQPSRFNTLMAAQKASSANNIFPLQLPGASWADNLLSARQASMALIPSDCSQVSNAEIMGQTNPSMVYNYSSRFAHQNSEMVTPHFASSKTIPSRALGSWLDLIRAPPSFTAPRLSDFITGTTSNDVDSLVRSSSSQLPFNILPNVDRSGHSQNTIDFLPRVYRCVTCSATFPSYQALGGHRGRHTKEKRKRDRLNLMPGTSHAGSNNEGGSSSKKKYKRKSS